MSTIEPEDLALDVWIDGNCPLCRRSRRWCEDREMRRCGMDCWNDGHRQEGFAAWREILRHLPRWCWLAAFTGVPPVSWVGPPLYRLVARFRQRVPVA